jgi:hypothetical protein
MTYEQDGAGEMLRLRQDEEMPDHHPEGAAVSSLPQALAGDDGTGEMAPAGKRPLKEMT